jgi:DNA-binding NarL/FixJ family response regulator
MTTNQLTPPAVFALAADMIFGAKIRATAQAVGVAILPARSPAHLIDLVTRAHAGNTLPRLIIIDLDTRTLEIVETIQTLKSLAPATRILAYVSHTNTSAITEARTAGADKILARSAFTESLATLLTDA